jgi:hypothetical protein
LDNSPPEAKNYDIGQLLWEELEEKAPTNRTGKESAFNSHWQNPLAGGFTENLNGSNGWISQEKAPTNERRENEVNKTLNEAH